ncbi:acyltransferase [Cellulomonas sp. H30R-01]|uniref:acyltransferase family protein n=1 Tax=Cellulomonas sp. H30R-01 TaxID=2704467 RepID=UPI00138B7376|nr:acyltransferase [Cellulomonas sp. H30R-01]QHT55076.1 acyltransferase [Cellulomonas sp. H30R-01]
MTHTPVGPPRPDSRRLASLDGLRGVAALVVVVHHSFLTSAVLLGPYLKDPVRFDPWTWQWFLTATPLHLLWDGTSAVFVFFVLSGLVLALPAASGAPARWDVYYVRRLLRLYLPVWGSLAFAWVTAVLVDRHQGVGSTWLQHREAWSPSGLPRDALLLGGVDALNGSLWTLQWEVWFSLLLPFYLLVARLLRRWLPVVAVGLLALVGVGWVVNSLGPLRYLPVFGLGVVMAFERDRLHRLAAALDARRRGWTLAYAGVVVAVSAYWLIFLVTTPSELVAAFGHTTGVAGAALAVFCAWHGPALRRLLESPPVQWLGTRSFSLYLVQEPVVTAVAIAWTATVGPGLTVAVAIPVSLACAALFYVVVERPSHRLSQRAGRAVGRRRARVPAPEPAPTAPEPAPTGERLGTTR